MARYAARRRIRRTPTASFTQDRRRIEPSPSPLPEPTERLRPYSREEIFETTDEGELREAEMELETREEGVRERLPEEDEVLEVTEEGMVFGAADRESIDRMKEMFEGKTSDEVAKYHTSIINTGANLLQRELEGRGDVPPKIVRMLNLAEKASAEALYEAQNAELLEKNLREYGPYTREMLDLLLEYGEPGSQELVDHYLDSFKQFLAVETALEDAEERLGVVEQDAFATVTPAEFAKKIIEDGGMIDLEGLADRLTGERDTLRAELQTLERDIAEARQRMIVPPSEQSRYETEVSRNAGLEARNRMRARHQRANRPGGFGRMRT